MENEKKINWFKLIGMPILMVGAAILLIISPIDVVPDAVPYAGYIDDVGYGLTGLVGAIASIVTEIKRIKKN